MPQFNATASHPHKGYRRDHQQAPECTVSLSIDFRIWRLTPDEARQMAQLLETAATEGERILKESNDDTEGDRIG